MIRITSGGASSATSSQITYDITEKLCKPYCVNNSFAPIVNKTWSVASTEVVNNITYAKMQCIVSVTYQPKGSCSVCGQRTNTFIESFTVSFSGSGAVTYTDSNAYTEPAYTNSCKNTAHGVENVGNMTLTFTAN